MKMALTIMLLLTACTDPEHNTCSPAAAQDGQCNPFRAAQEPHFDRKETQNG